LSGGGCVGVGECSGKEGFAVCLFGHAACCLTL